ncbi:MAG: hypothetical protein MI741_20880 [Rhodospirillales bacterium]|nr:hypothetical protein [Rhodospirillales bacterium]
MINAVSGPGPFTKDSAGSYLASQNWSGPNFDPKAGGFRYSHFTDPDNRIGGYVTPAGRSFTYGT